MIYLDNAATTALEPACSPVITKYNEELYYNPSALYSASSDLAKEIDIARKSIIKYLGGADNANLIFTSGATEANNIAILGGATQKQKRYLFSIGEHPAVYNTAIALKNMGYNVDFLPLNKKGEVDLIEFERMMDADVCFVSVMLVNNETGAINDLKAIRQIIDKKSPYCKFHVDAVQGFCKIPFNVRLLKVDLCTISAHKIHGPKGVGALYIAPNTSIKNITYGGGQEKGIRSGTYNVSGIMGFAKAVEIAYNTMQTNYDNVLVLKTQFIETLKPIMSDIVINGDGSPYVLSISIDGIRGETVLHMLENEGIIIGTGSACSSSKVENRVLTAMGRTKSEILGSVRISFGKYNTTEEIKVASVAVLQAIQKLLDMSKRK